MAIESDLIGRVLCLRHLSIYLKKSIGLNKTNNIKQIGLNQTTLKTYLLQSD